MRPPVKAEMEFRPTSRVGMVGHSYPSVAGVGMPLSEACPVLWLEMVATAAGVSSWEETGVTVGQIAGPMNPLRLEGMGVLGGSTTGNEGRRRPGPGPGRQGARRTSKMLETEEMEEAGETPGAAGAKGSQGSVTGGDHRRGPRVY